MQSLLLQTGAYYVASGGDSTHYTRRRVVRMLVQTGIPAQAGPKLITSGRIGGSISAQILYIAHSQSLSYTLRYIIAVSCFF
jgi:hypothetical protein